MAFIWSPLAATATRNLPSDVAGAGSGVYNATRQVGSVLGSASMAAFMTTRISAEMPLAADGPGGEGSVTAAAGVPARAVRGRDVAVAAAARVHRAVRGGGRDVPARLRQHGRPGARGPRRPTTTGTTTVTWSTTTTTMSNSPWRTTSIPRSPRRTPVPAPFVGTAAPVAPVVDTVVEPVGDESDTEPIPEVAVAPNPCRPGGTAGHRREPVRSLYDFLADVPPPKPSVEPIGFAHNGFHTDEEEQFQPLSRFKADDEEPLVREEPLSPMSSAPTTRWTSAATPISKAPTRPVSTSPPRHGLLDDETRSNGRHSRTEADDFPTSDGTGGTRAPATSRKARRR